jgi:hypothetical protein
MTVDGDQLNGQGASDFEGEEREWVVGPKLVGVAV